MYVLEKDHAPVEHGPLEFNRTLTGVEGREVLAAQAEAFLKSFRLGSFSATAGLL